MAKGNLFLGHAKGKVGSIVFSRAFGQQITRTKPSSVKNPKTRAQNAQRAILATVAKAASIMTPIVNHSFAGVAYGTESVRHFRKINLNQLRALYMDGDPTGFNLTPKGGAVVPNSYIVSQGNLPAFQMAYSGDSYGFKMSNETLPANTEVTVSTFLAAYPYLKGGDQLTLVQLVKTSGDMNKGDAKFVLMYDRIVFAPNAFDNPDSVIVNDDGTFNEEKFDLTKTTNADMLVLSPIGNEVLMTSQRRNVYAAVLILSRQVNGVWQRSTQEMGLTHDSDVQDIEAAIATYGASASESADNEYLNQADDNDNTVSGVSGAYMNMSVKVGDDKPRIFNVKAGSVEDETLQGAAGTIVAISAQALAPTGKRVVSVEIDRPDGSYAAHGATSLNYNVAIAAQTAGLWKVIALYDDGTKAEYHATLAVKA